MDLAIIIGTMVSFWIIFGTIHLTGKDTWRVPFIFLVILMLCLVCLRTKVINYQGSSGTGSWHRLDMLAVLASMACIEI